MDTIGDRLKDVRTGQRLSQEDLAALSGVSALTIIRIEQGSSKPRLETLRKLATSLDLPVESLAFGKPEPSSVRDDDDEMDAKEMQAVAAHMAASARDMLDRLRTLEKADALPPKEMAKVRRALKQQEAHIRKMDRLNANMSRS